MKKIVKQMICSYQRKLPILTKMKKTVMNKKILMTPTQNIVTGLSLITLMESMAIFFICVKIKDLV